MYDPEVSRPGPEVSMYDPEISRPTESLLAEVLAEGSRQDGVAVNDSLFSAVRSGDAELIRDLIRRGTDINVRDERGWSPLDYARKNNRREIRLLLQAAGL
jgi:hypothetical protein